MTHAHDMVYHLCVIAAAALYLCWMIISQNLPLIVHDAAQESMTDISDLCHKPMPQFSPVCQRMDNSF